MKKILKTLTGLGLSEVLAVGATVCVACGDKTPEKTKSCSTSSPTPSITLETAKNDYNGIVTNIKNAKSLTSSVVSQDRTTLIEIQDNKLKQTNQNSSKFYETVAEGQTFEYALQDEDWHKTVAEESLNANSMHTSITNTLERITWTAVSDDGTLTGTFQINESSQNRTSITGTYNKQDNSLTLNIPNQTMSIYNVGNTIVNIPQNSIDDTQEKPPVEEEFKITAENIEEVKAAARKHVENINEKVLKNYSTLQDVYSFYLTKSEGSSVVDTIGAVYTMKHTTGSILLEWIELTIPTNENLSYEQIYNNELSYELKSTSYDQKFSFAVGDEEKYSEMVETLKTQTFGQDYTDNKNTEKLWTGWYGNCDGTSSDGHKLVMFYNGVIQEVYYSIKNNGHDGMVWAVENNFAGKEESETTYSKTTQNYIVKDSNRIFLEIEKTTTEKEMEG